MTATASADTGFAIRLYDALAKAHAGQDLFLSPFSIHAALAMVGAAARGETRHELAALLGEPESVEQQNRRYAGWIEQVTSDTAGHVQLAIANGLWGQQGVAFNPSYRQAIADCYGGALNEVDFQASPGDAVQTINAWVAGKTAGKVAALVTPELVGRDTRLIATNAIYFKGRWASAFDPKDTLDDDWHGPRGIRKVPLMQQRGGFRYCETAQYQALELLYQGEHLSMVIVLPRETTAALDAAGLTYRQVTSSLAFEKRVIVSLPRFKIAGAFQLKPVLSELGAVRLFSPSADFSGMSVPPPQFGDVVHQAVIEVNEEGTEATGATAVVLRKGGAAGQPKVFLADHPFVFFIRHRQSNAVLFCGHVLEPA
jgi:serpin B